MNASGKTISCEPSRSTASFAKRCSLSSVEGVSLYTVEHCATDARMVGDDISSVPTESTIVEKGKHCHRGFTSATSQCGQKVYKHAVHNEKSTCCNVKGTASLPAMLCYRYWTRKTVFALWLFPSSLSLTGMHANSGTPLATYPSSLPLSLSQMLAARCTLVGRDALSWLPKSGGQRCSGLASGLSKTSAHGSLCLKQVSPGQYLPWRCLHPRLLRSSPLRWRLHTCAPREAAWPSLEAYTHRDSR